MFADEDIDFSARVPKKTGCTDHDNNIRWGVDEGAIFWSAEEVAYEPGLATGWEFSDDLLQLTFDIRYAGLSPCQSTGRESSTTF